jgi:hypothetical protein
VLAAVRLAERVRHLSLIDAAINLDRHLDGKTPQQLAAA